MRKIRMRFLGSALTTDGRAAGRRRRVASHQLIVGINVKARRWMMIDRRWTTDEAANAKDELDEV